MVGLLSGLIGEDSGIGYLMSYKCDANLDGALIDSNILNALT